MSEGNAHRMKMVQDLEARLSPEKLEIWKAVHGLLPTGHPYVGTDYGLELYLLNAIGGGAQVKDLMRYIPTKPIHPRGPERRHEPDRRTLASGETGMTGVRAVGAPPTIKTEPSSK